MEKGIKVIIVAAVFLTILFSNLAFAKEDSCSEPLPLAQGLVKGKESPDYAACVWKGIPYAAPPVGDLRLRATQPPGPHEGTMAAYEFGPACPQGKTMFSGGDVEGMSEDCLTLNIWSPRKSGNFPVMIWIHGGAFILGSGSYDLYNGARLAAETDVVVVTINYRLGALGFLALPELADEDPNGSTGNYGLMDQIQALMWVRENIREFRGDPDNVTIFGQSAGGASVCCLLASPPARGLFHKAIPMSGSCDIIATLDHGYDQGKNFVKKMKCEGTDVLECLRKKPEEAFMPGGVVTSFISGSGVTGYFPHDDGYVLKGAPIEAIREGNYNRVPVLVGNTRDEVRMFTMVVPGMSLIPRFAINRAIKAVFKDRAERIMELYSYSDYKHPSQLMLAVFNDAFISEGHVAAQALAENGDPVYLYRFDWHDINFPDKIGAFHGLDIPFVFGNNNPDTKLSLIVRKKQDYEQGPMYWQIMYYYSNFAKTADPNGQGPEGMGDLPQWPMYTVENRERIYLDNQITVAPLTEKEIERYEFFSEYGIGGLIGENE